MLVQEGGGWVLYGGLLKRLQMEEVVGLSLESDCESLNRLACAFLPRDAAIDGERELNPFGNI